jgi:hypothetical protein
MMFLYEKLVLKRERRGKKQPMVHKNTVGAFE